MEGKGNFFNIILLLIVAFLTLTLAALAGYVFIAGGSKPAQTVVQKVDTSIPKDDELEHLKLYADKPEVFNLKNVDKSSSMLPVIQVSAEISYFKEAPKGSSVKDTKVKIEGYHGRIKQLIGTYFMNLTLEDVKQPDAKKKVSEELKKSVNELINENEDEKKDIVYEITFDKWFYS